MKHKISRRSFLSFALSLSAAGVLSLAACAQSPRVESLVPSSSSESTEESPMNSNTLVVYFSHSGNTQRIAEQIESRLDCDLLRLEPAEPYAAGYGDSDRVKAERDENARPAIANLPASLDQYSSILVGYPIWWHTAPMIIGTFLESYDLTGREVYVFAQSASMDEEQFTQSMEFVRGCASGANVHDGLFARPSDTAAIETYLTQNSLL